MATNDYPLGQNPDSPDDPFQDPRYITENDDLDQVHYDKVRALEVIIQEGLKAIADDPEGSAARYLRETTSQPLIFWTTASVDHNTDENEIHVDLEEGDFTHHWEVSLAYIYSYTTEG